MAKEKIRLKEFPQTFWVANTLEIFERMAWYGFFAVSSLYITGTVSSGGLGFTDEDRGVLQGVVTFFLYLFPVVTGALADRYGFKRMLTAAFLVLIPSYYLLGHFKTFPTFFLAFMLVAIGAAMFKPVIIGTVSKTTNEKTSSLGFGIFYMMVNIGGFVGPIVAGIVRGWSWEYVFIASSCWIFVNLIIVLIFYKEPPTQSNQSDVRSLKKVLQDMVEVLGNGRFFLFVFGLLAVLVLGSKFTSDGSFDWGDITLIAVGWTILNFIYDFVIRKSNNKAERPWITSPMKLGDWKFGLFLLLMSGFWTSFNQIFYTLPLYIRDFTNTTDLMNVISGMMSFVGLEGSIEAVKNSMAIPGQVNPEYIININAGAIIFFQVFVSYLVTRLKPFTTIFWGVMITVVSFTILIFGTLGWIVVAGILVFSFGEMMASPKSKEYTGKIAPPNKVALYMGYFYWCVALGNLFGGILSGQLYAAFARDMQRPDIMWIIFALLALVSALLILSYDKLVIKRK
ncbi:MAG: MFS transporter [Ignavibacteria bacterium]|nr:MFS transporter [Ignavibacteria bacterium]MBT8381251.1 MFS transporter [Ignavibacteria bacterium]MBT8391273.1 MFS transporter [Ignavibacteria bacterium]NNJ54382.1 MFS transporter [Ignavibacteriaceae bacterium]NNL21694.1 MFS transporter [Ignavibacteriaceae bacterium]